MMTVALFWLASVPSEAELLRAVYQVEIFRKTRRAEVSLALNMLDEERFSIRCRKEFAGALFTYWATPEQDVLLFHKEDVAFIGPAGSAIRLLPGGPALGRDQWRRLLLEDPPRRLGAYRLQKTGEWGMMTHRKARITIRWREKSRALKTRYSQRTLVPSLPEDVEVRSLADFTAYWDQNELD